MSAGFGGRHHARSPTPGRSPPCTADPHQLWVLLLLLLPAMIIHSFFSRAGGRAASGQRPHTPNRSAPAGSGAPFSAYAARACTRRRKACRPSLNSRSCSDRAAGQLEGELMQIAKVRALVITACSSVTRTPLWSSLSLPPPSTYPIYAHAGSDAGTTTMDELRGGSAMPAAAGPLAPGKGGSLPPAPRVNSTPLRRAVHDCTPAASPAVKV